MAGIGMGPDGTVDTGMAMDLDGTAAIDPECMGIDVVRTGAGSSAFRKAPIDNGRRCPLLAPSGHGPLRRTCPLSAVKRTSLFAAHMSASDPKRNIIDERQCSTDRAVRVGAALTWGSG